MARLSFERLEGVARFQLLPLTALVRRGSACVYGEASVVWMDR